MVRRKPAGQRPTCDGKSGATHALEKLLASALAKANVRLDGLVSKTHVLIVPPAAPSARMLARYPEKATADPAPDDGGASI